MSDFKNTGSFPVQRPDDDADREARHQVLATLLGAYADGEVPTETASQIDAHLLGCVRCRRELDVHRSIRARLEAESIAPASAALRERILAGVSTTPIALPAEIATSPSGSFGWRGASRTSRVLAAAAVVAVLLTGGVWWRASSDRASAAVTVVAEPTVMLFSEVLADYRRVTATELPGRSRDLATVRAALPFAVRPLVSPELRLLAAWTTDLRGEPAAVLAYRWNNQLVLQYIVSEQLLFRPPEIRRAFADGHRLATRSGAQSVIAWPASASGELLVADLSVNALASLRATVDDR